MIAQRDLVQVYFVSQPVQRHIGGQVAKSDGSALEGVGVAGFLAAGPGVSPNVGTGIDKDAVRANKGLENPLYEATLGHPMQEKAGRLTTARREEHKLLRGHLASY